MTNIGLFNNMWIWAIVFTIGIGLLCGYLAAYSFCDHSYNRPFRCFSDDVYQTGINAGISLTVIGGIFGFLSCLFLDRRLRTTELNNPIMPTTVVAETTTTVENIGNNEIELTDIETQANEVVSHEREAKALEKEITLLEKQKRIAELKKDIRELEASQVVASTSV